ncbi:hypothetical protein CROQUDRAFT_714580 [Cronartium quercuum f. sp. fusiforme G11]|uniref:lytic cellulose monooxygenase (C4-dehydrogenating) n=1 Tax=Cronartium quercuum f. sp. fusiforme G11 TaxID=708437 RepID=A0A9P6NJR2_9BASI|nr:hypothetical protein CROQUDRAFT_714580 [Cronartium quercuum f. sp. fusiforme G11]
MTPMTSSLLISLLWTVCSLNLFQLVSAHAYIKQWSADGGQLEFAQKQSLSDTAFRGVSKNTGWIGSKFIDSEAITCGATDTPKGTIAPPGGPFFHTADQSAKKTLSVKAGGKIELVLAGESGKGFPHPNGHIQTYLGYCGPKSNACVDFDASKAKYFKIQAEINAISDKLRPNFDPNVDGNKWEIPIPDFIPPGSFIMRLELITFDQSSDTEGKQDQYYVYCGQIFVTTSQTSISALSQFDSVHFPEAYEAGNRDKHSLPGPSVVSGTAGSKSQKKTCKSQKSSKSSSSDLGGQDFGHGDSSAGHQKLTACGGTCLKAKTTAEELKHLAPTCSPDDLSCLCRSHKWVCAYVSCANDNCQGGKAKDATDEVYSKCGAILASRSRLPSTDYITEHQNPSSTERFKSKSCMDTCFNDNKQLHGSSCSPGNLDCVCKDHAAVCTWAKCAETNCQDNTDTIRLASDAIYEKCSAITHSPVRRKR